MLPAPTVSVILPVYNGEQFLPLAVTSILRQTFSDLELIVVDDGSTDRTPEQLRSVNDTRLRIVCNSSATGPAGARNAGIDAVRGKFCAFLDHDDVAFAFRLERQLAFLESNPAVGLVGSAIEVIDAAGTSSTTIKMPETSPAIRWMGLLDCPMRQSSLMGRAELVKKFRYDPGLPNYSDWDFVMRVAREAEVRNQPDVLIQYRRHATNITKLHAFRLHEIGIDIALREIHFALPHFETSRAEVAELRKVLFDTTTGPATRTMDVARRALERYLDLAEAFRKKYPIDSIGESHDAALNPSS